MFIVTNREVDEARKDLKAFKSHPNRLGPNELRLAQATRAGRTWSVQILPDDITDRMATEVGLKREIDPETNQRKPLYASRYLARKVLARVNPAAVGSRAKGRNLLFFVHDFNNDVGAVLDRAEQFEKNFGVEVVAFTWPANGGGVHGAASYKSDKRDARWHRPGRWTAVLDGSMITCRKSTLKVCASSNARRTCVSPTTRKNGTGFLPRGRSVGVRSA